MKELLVLKELMKLLWLGVKNNMIIYDLTRFEECEICNKISIDNLKDNSGTLDFSFYRILDVVEKDGFEPCIRLYENNEGVICGYIIYYHNLIANAIQISHIVVASGQQRKHIGSILLNDLLDTYSNKNFTADIEMGNTNSEELFKSCGFNLIAKKDKPKWYAKLYK